MLQRKELLLLWESSHCYYGFYMIYLLKIYLWPVRFYAVESKQTNWQVVEKFVVNKENQLQETIMSSKDTSTKGMGGSGCSGGGK